jgi:hypothetical protein
MAVITHEPLSFSRDFLGSSARTATTSRRATDETSKTTRFMMYLAEKMWCNPGKRIRSRAAQDN